MTKAIQKGGCIKARRKRAQKRFTDSLKRNESGGVNITKKTIENKYIFDLLNSFSGTPASDGEALKAIISECNENGIQYTLSAYCENLLKQGAAV